MFGCLVVSTVGPLSILVVTDLNLISHCSDKLEAAKELKVLAKTADDAYWQKNCAQVGLIVSVL